MGEGYRRHESSRVDVHCNGCLMNAQTNIAEWAKNASLDHFLECYAQLCSLLFLYMFVSVFYNVYNDYIDMSLLCIEYGVPEQLAKRDGICGTCCRHM